MKMIWTLFLTSSLFYTADAIECWTCVDPPLCTNTALRNCSVGQLCLNSQVSVMLTGFDQAIGLKACAAASFCTSLGASTAAFSTNLGFVNAAVTAECCDTDRCNSGTLEVTRNTTNSGLTCFTCDSPADEYCNTTVNCTGIQDRCINGSVSVGVNTANTFGCASASVCGAIDQVLTLPELSSVANFTQNFTCCEENCCNSASMLSLSILPLLMLPLAFILHY